MSGFKIDEANFNIPTKKIFDVSTTQVFQSSVAIQRLRFYIAKYCSMVEGTSYDEDTLMNNKAQYPSFHMLLKYVFEPLKRLIRETPPLTGPRRFGNFACRDWHDKVNAQIPQELNLLMEEFITTLSSDSENNAQEKIRYTESVCELEYYLLNAFGSRERLDFGTGHELSFLAFLGGLDMMGMLSHICGLEVIGIFYQYCNIVEDLIVTYNLEPAGSHGVWGLDDHFHLSYMLGSSQMINNAAFKYITPRTILADPYIVDDHYKQILYFWNIHFLKSVKRGPFEEHSPILYDISKSVKVWAKVLNGLTRMYNDEVLNKFPVVQHFWFGLGFYPWKSVENGKNLVETEKELSDDLNRSRVTMDSINNSNDNSYDNSSTATLTMGHPRQTFGQSSIQRGFRQPQHGPDESDRSALRNKVTTSMLPPSISYPTRNSKR